MRSRLAKILLTYRVTPQSTTGLAPAELLLGRRLRTRLDLPKPNTAERVELKQQQQNERHDSRGKARTFHIGDSVFEKNNSAGLNGLPGNIVETSGPVSFRVLLEDGRCKRCHQDQLRHRFVDDDPPDMTHVPVDESVPIPLPSRTELSASDSAGTSGPEQEPDSPLPSDSAQLPAACRTIVRDWTVWWANSINRYTSISLPAEKSKSLVRARYQVETDFYRALMCVLCYLFLFCLSYDCAWLFCFVLFCL